MKIQKTLLLTLTILTAISCSIKEDRSPCPCWLSIDLSRCTQENLTVAAWTDYEIFSERISVQDFLPEGSYEKTVPRGYVNTSVVYGERDMLRSGTMLTIPLGQDCDSLWAHAASVECLGENAIDTAILHKQFARVFMSVDIPEGHEYPYTFTVYSDVCGLDLRNLTPIEGGFKIDLELDKDNVCMFCLPRQKEDGGALKLHIHDNGEVIETIPMAEWISRMGYNWRSIDLEDIYIGVDYARAEVSISIRGWDDGNSFIVEI